MAARRGRTELCKALCLACWNADKVRGRKLELENFLSQHSVDICLLSETFLNPGQAFRLSNFVCHRVDGPTAGGRHRHLGPAWYSPPLGARSGPDPLGGYCHPSHISRQTGANPRGLPSSSRPLIGLQVLMAGDLNAKHVDWNSRLSSRLGKLLRDYADGNSCLIFGPDSSTTNPYNPSVIPGVSDFVLCTKLSPSPSSHLHCVSLIFSAPTGYALTSGALTGPISKLTWKNLFHWTRNCTTRWQSTRPFRTSLAPFRRLWQR